MNTTPRDPAPSAVADRLAEIFDLVGPLYHRAQRRVEHDVSNEGLSLGVRAVLNMLRTHGPMTVPQMGRAQALSRQFVQRMVNEAAARRLVESIPNPAHKKSALIRLTDEGQTIIATVINRERAILSHAGGDLTDADLAGCTKVLSQLLRFLDNADID